MASEKGLFIGFFNMEVLNVLKSEDSWAYREGELENMGREEN